MPLVSWTLDPTHSEVTFKIKHLMITSVTGQFTDFNATIETEGEDFLSARVRFSVQTRSVTTNNEQRDAHLQSPDFFDVAKYPQIDFVATEYKSVDDDGSYELYGNLTIRDITRPVILEVEFGGIIKDPWGNTRAGFTITGKINRKDFGLHWHGVTEAGGIVLSDEVRIHCNAELIKQA